MTSRRVYLDYLDDIVQATQRVEEFTRGMDEARFRADAKTVYAVTRAFEVIGEATKNLPADVRARHPEIPWAEMAGMRDKLIHGYFGVDEAVLWETAQRSIPPLRKAIERALEAERHRT